MNAANAARLSLFGLARVLHAAGSDGLVTTGYRYRDVRALFIRVFGTIARGLQKARGVSYDRLDAAASP